MATERIEEYLEALDEIIKGKGYAKVKDVAAFLSISPPSVTEMLQKLNEKGYIHYEKYSGVTLTNKGEKLASQLRKKHETLKQFFEIIGVPQKIADEDACRIEHVINKVTLNQVAKFVLFMQDSNIEKEWNKQNK
jgi:DtxR family transcriptional regulator, Mn-dependent transcriptional regulator